MKVAVYIRTSRSEQNPENQLQECLSINKYGDYELFKDRQSAWKDNIERDDFERLNKLIKGNKIEHLIVWDFDRLYRNRIKFKQFLEFLKAYKVKLHSYRQQWLEDIYKIPSPWNDIVSELMINIYGHIAQDESDKKSMRVKSAVRKENGITKSYKGKKWGKPQVQEKVKKRIVELREQGKSYREICKEVFYWDNSRNKHFVSMGLVHKILSKSNTKGIRNKVIH